MKGLEPSTFCMANASDRSLLFASVRSNRLFSGFPIGRANASEPERTPNLAILATPRSGREPLPSQLHKAAGFAPATLRRWASSERTLAHASDFEVETLGEPSRCAAG
jgi:hypothetical protein